MLDVLATMAVDQDVGEGGGGFLARVDVESLMGEEEKGYWDQISLC